MDVFHPLLQVVDCIEETSLGACGNSIIAIINFLQCQVELENKMLTKIFRSNIVCQILYCELIVHILNIINPCEKGCVALHCNLVPNKLILPQAHQELSLKLCHELLECQCQKLIFIHCDPGLDRDCFEIVDDFVHLIITLNICLQSTDDMQF